MAYWAHDIDPVVFQLSDSLAVRWYGVAYILGFVIAAWLLACYYRKERSPLDPDAQSSLLTALIIGVLVGGRVGYLLLYQPEAWLHHPLLLFQVWQGGMASHGGFVGVAVAALWVSRRRGIAILRLSDILVTLAPPGIFLGRIANFINGELWGRPAEVPWAVSFREGPLGEYGPPRHPSQLYEAVLEGLVLTVYTQVRFWLSDPAKLRPGQLAGEFFIAYAILRIIGEVFREPDAGLILGLSRGVFYSFFLLLAGIVILSRRFIRLLA